MDYAIALQGKMFTPNGRVEMTAAEVEAHNAKLETELLKVWSVQPDRFVVYIVRKEDSTVRQLNSAEWKPEVWYIATTWKGTRLSEGRVERTKGRHNMARSMTSIRFRGTNGATYYGRFSEDNSHLCRVRKAK